MYYCSAYGHSIMAALLPLCCARKRVYISVMYFLALRSPHDKAFNPVLLGKLCLLPRTSQRGSSNISP